MLCVEWCSDSYAAHSPGAPMLTAFEPLLLRYHVDLTLTGHEHGYERVHPVRNGSVVATPGVDGVYHNPPAPVHLMIGSAGALQEERYVSMGVRVALSYSSG